jgi:hypothetical protein
MTIDEILGNIRKSNLSGNCDLFTMLVANGGSRAVRVVEHDSDTGLCDASLTTFIDKILLIRCTHGRHIRQSKNEGDCVEDVGFAGPIKAGNRVERWIPSCDLSADRIRLEACRCL